MNLDEARYLKAAVAGLAYGGPISAEDLDPMWFPRFAIPEAEDALRVYVELSLDHHGENLWVAEAEELRVRLAWLRPGRPSDECPSGWWVPCPRSAPGAVEFWEVSS